MEWLLLYKREQPRKWFCQSENVVFLFVGGSHRFTLSDEAGIGLSAETVDRIRASKGGILSGQITGKSRAGAVVNGGASI
jgi:hypothetical protein